MSATSLDLSQIKTDALSAASSFRTLIGLGTGNTPTFLGTTLTGGTVTASAPLIDATQTWNSAATVFTGLRFNVVDTASSASSLLMDLQVGGSSRFNIKKGGEIVIAGGSIFRPLQSGSGAAKFAILQHHVNVLAMFEGQTDTGFAIGDTAKGAMNGAWVNLAGSFGWYGMDSSTPDLRLYRDTANTLAQRNAGNAQRFNLYGTYTDASNYRRLYLNSTTAGAFTLGVEGAGTGASGNTLELQTGGTTRVTISASGQTTFSTRATIDTLTVGLGGQTNVSTNTAFGFETLNSASLTGGANVGVGYQALRACTSGFWNTAVGHSALLAATSGWANTALGLQAAVTLTSGTANTAIGMNSLQSVGSTSCHTAIGRGALAAVNTGSNNTAVGCDCGNTITSGSDNIAIGNNVQVDSATGSNQINIGNRYYHNRAFLYNTFTDASNYERGKLEWSSNVFRIGTEKAGTGSARALELQTDGTTRLTINSNGGVVSSSFLDCTSIRVNGSQVLADFSYLSRLGLDVGSAGGYTVIRLGGTFQNANTLICIGGTSSSFPAIKRNGTAINFRLADDSADCDITAAHGTFSAGTDTASNPILNLSQTWNNAATTFTGILANVTDTASNASSLLMDLQVGGSSRFSVNKNGTAVATFNTAVTTIGQRWIGTDGTTYWNAGGIFESGNSNIQLDARGGIVGSGQGRVNLGAGYLYLEGGPTTTGIRTFGSLIIAPAALGSTGAIEQRNGVNAQTFRIYNTFTDASNYERGKLEWASNVLRIGTEKAGTGSARALELQTDGTTRLTFSASAHDITTNENARILLGASTTGRLHIQNSTVGQLWINQRGVFGVTGTDAVWLFSGWNIERPRLCFGGTTSFFPSIKATSAALNFRLADDSADCDITAAALTLSGNLTISTKDIVTDTTTGTKIGTATNQKLGFFNATPVVQPTAVADATDAASVITQLNALLTRMRNLGLIAT